VHTGAHARVCTGACCVAGTRTRRCTRRWRCGADRAAALARYGPIGEWDTGGVTDMRDLFCGKEGFNDDIGGWDVSNVTTMVRMSYEARAFNQPLHMRDVSNVTHMYCMFETAVAFNQPLQTWDVSKVTSMNGMFNGCATFDQPATRAHFDRVIRPTRHARAICARVCAVLGGYRARGSAVQACK
jgi:hypothetical protein